MVILIPNCEEDIFRTFTMCVTAENCGYYMLFLKITIYNYASRATLELTNFLHIPNSKYCMAYTLHAMYVVSVGHAIMTIKFLE
jgi:hypothetical protein